MNTISEKIQNVFSDCCSMNNPENESLFDGYNLPPYVKDVIIRGFSISNDKVNKDGLKAYLTKAIPRDMTQLKARLMVEKSVHVLVRFVITSDLKTGKVKVNIPDAGMNDGVFVDETLLARDDFRNDLSEGEHWGEVTLQYMRPQEDNKTGSVLMTNYKAFKPYKVHKDIYCNRIANFNMEDRLDFLLTDMKYNPDFFKSKEEKMAVIKRLLVLVEPNLNIIELGPKGTGKSHVMNNVSQHITKIDNGSSSRAQLIYNIKTGMYGPIVKSDAVCIDEANNYDNKSNRELQSSLKNFLEAGKVTVAGQVFTSECSFMLAGNIEMGQNGLPRSRKIYKALPKFFQDSALMDRFHGFIEGWKVPRLTVGCQITGTSLDAEYFDALLHELRFEPAYKTLAKEIITFGEDADMRDVKAVYKLSTAFMKLLLPDIISKEQIWENPDILQQINDYCLQPAIKMRSLIRIQCSLKDEEYSSQMPDIWLELNEGERQLVCGKETDPSRLLPAQSTVIGVCTPS